MRITDHYNELETEIDLLYTKFIKVHLPADPERTPDSFVQDVKSFCILTHAAFENFTESISISISDKIKTVFREKEKITKTTLIFLISHTQKKDVAYPSLTETETPFLFIEQLLSEAYQKHRYNIKHNHGFGLKYLEKIFHPIGLQTLPTNPAWETSLEKLTSARGAFAHTLSRDASYMDGRARTVLTPEGAEEIVKDCLKFCEEIKAKATLLYNELEESSSTSLSS